MTIEPAPAGSAEEIVPGAPAPQGTPANGGSGAAPVPSRKERRRFGGLAWTVVVALVAFASSMAALVFQLWPGLRPDPRDRLGAEVSVFAIDPGVSVDQWLRRAAFSEEDYEKAAAQRIRAACGEEATRSNCNALRSRGEMLYVRTTVEGFKRREVAMRVSLYDAATHARVATIDAVEVARERLDAPTDKAVLPIWMPCPPDASKTYFFRIELAHRGDEALLAVGDSKPFRALRC